MVLVLVLSLLPDHLWVDIVGQYIGHGDAFPVALTCRLFKHAAFANANAVGTYGFKTPVSTVVVSVPMLRWAVSCGYQWDSRTCAFAACCGNLSVLQWARANGCEWDACTCSFAAVNGHLAIVQWAVNSGCAWDRRTCIYAASTGHLDVLQWAIDNGCDR